MIETSLCYSPAHFMSDYMKCRSQMEYVRTQTKPKDGKLLAIGHSMGGMLLYALLSRCGKPSDTPYSLYFILNVTLAFCVA